LEGESVTLGPGSQLGKYKIDREIARGGMGVVYLAVDNIGRQVAIKSLSPDYAADEAWRARFTVEAERLGALNHPNIATIFERLDLDDGTSYLVLEYIEGKSLRSALSPVRVPVVERLLWCVQIARGLEAAHNRTIVHRDIKPENIQIRSDGTAKILDFGLAIRGVSAAADATTRATEAMSILRFAGTPGYMSPEQIRGRSVDKRTDVFSFGCVLFECVTGQPAFPGTTQDDRNAAALQDPPEWSIIPAEIPSSVHDLACHCLEKSLTERLGDMATARYQLDSAVRQMSGDRHSPHRSKLAVAPPGNLPPQVAEFIGRQDVVERLVDVVTSRRLCTIFGPGGCGKTSLAVRLAHALASGFPNGTWFVDLATTDDPAKAIDIVATSIGVKAVEGESLEASVKSRLASGEALLLLDNCEHLLPGLSRTVNGLLHACPQLKILATSRELLRLPGEQAYSLPPLGLPGDVSQGVDADARRSESVQLFIARARQVRPDFDPKRGSLAAVARICHKLDGIPLAIELAAARIKMLSPEQIEDRLEQIIARPSDTVDRHATMASALDWSYRLLAEDERHALHRLEVFSGTFSLAAACTVLERPDDGALEVLTRLWDKSLIVAEFPEEDASTEAETRYRLLTLVREHLSGIRQRTWRTASEALFGARTDWPRVCDLHLQYYERLADDAERGLRGSYEHWRRVIQVERSNLVGAMRHAIGPYHPGARGFEYAARVRKIWKAVFHTSELSQSSVDCSSLERTLRLSGLRGERSAFVELIMNADDSPDPHLFLADAKFDADSLVQIRNSAKSLAVNSVASEGVLSGRILFALSVSYALVRLGRQISDMSDSTLERFLEDVGTLVPYPWRELIQKARRQLANQ
jgi:non-specific serine/threonine protein kinase